jgi:hypothetical protein
MKLIKATVAGLALPAGKSDHIAWDDELKGFGLRLRASGQHVWVCQYQIEAQQRRLTLGSIVLFSPEEGWTCTLGGNPWDAAKAISHVNAAWGHLPGGGSLTVRRNKNRILAYGDQPIPEGVQRAAS